MKRFGATCFVAIVLAALSLIAWGQAPTSRNAAQAPVAPSSARYQQLQQRLAVGWNTWDVHSVTTQVLLPDGLAIHVGLKHNTTLWQDAFLGDALIGRLTPDAEQVFPGPHSWEGSYTDFAFPGRVTNYACRRHTMAATWSCLPPRFRHHRCPPSRRPSSSL